MRKLATIIAMTVFGGFAGRAQTASAENPGVIQVNTRLVPVDVVVRNGKGPVSGLTKDDFTLFDKGKRQEIALFKVTDARTARELAAPLPEGVVSNRMDQNGGEVRNTTAILVDHLNTPPEMQIFGDNQVVKFLQTVKQGDRIAIYLLSDGSLRVIQDFTTDLARLLQAASRLRPDDSKIDSLTRMLEDLNAGRTPGELLKGLQAMAIATNVDRAGQTTQALTAIAKHLTGLAGRKNLVWVSAGFPLGLGGSGGLGTCPRCGTVTQFQDQIEKSARFLNEANIAVYPVDPHGVRPDGLAPGVGASQQDTMKMTAQLTGGEAFFQTNDLSRAIREAIEDGDVTYTLGFYPQERALDGSFHELRVKVEKSGLVEKGGMDVRFRKGYFASKETAPTRQQVGQAIQDALANPLDATAVGLTAKSEANPARPGSYRLTAWVGIGDLHLEREETPAGVVWTGDLAATFRAESSKDSKFEVVDIPIKLNQEQFQAALKDGFAVHRTMDAMEHDRVRLVVQDVSTGATGSVWIPLGVK